MMRSAFLVGALAAIPSVSAAQGIQLDGAVTLGYAFNSIGIAPGLDADLNGYSSDFDGDLAFSEEFSVGLGFGFSSGDLDIAGTSINVDLINLAVEPVYMHSSGAYIGAYYRMNDLDLAVAGPITLGIDTTQYGLFGGYDFGQGHVEVFYGMTDLDPSSVIPLGGLNLEATDFGISGSYQVMPQLEVFGTYMQSNIDFAGFEVIATAYALGAEYDLSEQLAIYGSFGGGNLDLSDLGVPFDITATNFTLGASYDLTSAASMPLILSAEYSRTDIDLGFGGLEPEIDRFAVGLTIPLGGGSGDALNSNTRTARGEYRSAIEAVFNSL